MDAPSLRSRFLEFFVERGHLAHEPAGLIPAGDPSVLFTTAGMQQFKPYYLGVETPPAPRITTVQPCFRTSDIENVGRTARHLTFFEMLGNFAFGDYFKEEAIAWALELSDELGLPRERIWASVFGGDEQVPADEESIAIWKGHDFPDEKIIRLPRSENFWGPAGPTGPCGPCSELYYDNGPEVGCGRPDCAPGCDCDRFIEYWNLVFTEYDMDERGGSRPCPTRTSTPAWASSASPPSHRGSSRSTTPTSSGRSSSSVSSSRVSHTTRRTRRVAPCARWPSTRAASPSSSPTA